MISVAALEEAVLVLLCYSKEQAANLALRLTPEIFTTRVNQKIAETALKYITQYSLPPGGQLEYLLEIDLRRGDEGKLLGQTLDFLRQQESQIQPAFVLEQLDKFIEIQKMTSNLQQAMESLHVGDLTKAQELVYTSSTPQVNGNSGIWLKDPKGMLAGLDNSRDEFFSTGIPTFDAAGVQLERKTFSIIIAPAKKGKTWWLIELGKAGIQHHHSVLHITLELSQEKTALRYVQSMFSLTKDEAKQIETPFFVDNGKGGFSIDMRKLSRDSIIMKRADIRDKLATMKFPPMLIKEFPTGSLSTEQLNLYLDYLRRDFKFQPDLLIIDYADLMKLNAESLRIDTGRQYKDLRGVSIIRNCALASASQGNKDSDTAKVVDKRHAAEDWSKIGTVDLAFTYSQTAEERKLGLARMLLAAGRDVPDRMMVLISQAYSIGQFCLDSTFMAANVFEELSRLTGDDEKEKG